MRYEVFKDEEFILDGFNHKEGIIEIELPLGQYDLYVEYTPTGRYMEKFTFDDITVPNDFPITIMPSPY
jgi:hypothetical protein